MKLNNQSLYKFKSAGGIIIKTKMNIKIDIYSKKSSLHMYLIYRQCDEYNTLSLSMPSIRNRHLYVKPFFPTDHSLSIFTRSHIHIPTGKPIPNKIARYTNLTALDGFRVGASSSHQSLTKFFVSLSHYYVSASNFTWSHCVPLSPRVPAAPAS